MSPMFSPGELSCTLPAAATDWPTFWLTAVPVNFAPALRNHFSSTGRFCANDGPASRSRAALHARFRWIDDMVGDSGWKGEARRQPAKPARSRPSHGPCHLEEPVLRGLVAFRVGAPLAANSPRWRSPDRLSTFPQPDHMS